MELEKLKELNNKILSMASILNAIIEDHFDEESEYSLIKKNLEAAWWNLDAALDNFHFEITTQEKQPDPAGADQGEPVPVLSKDDYRAMLKSLKPEIAEKDLKAAKEIFSWANEIKNLDTDLIPTFAAMMLIEYGKRAGKKERAQATDPGEKEGD